MADGNPFDYLKSINDTKINMMRGSENDSLAESSYPAFVCNRGLSLFPDTIILAAEMNKYHELDKKLQYEYYLYSVRKRKRFSKWPKKEKLEDLEIIKKYFGYNNTRALEALSILTDDQLEKIRTIMKV